MYMKKKNPKDRQSALYVRAAQLQESVSQLGFRKKSGESGEAYISKMVKFLENLTDIDLKKIGQKHGNI